MRRITREEQWEEEQHQANGLWGLFRSDLVCLYKTEQAARAALQFIKKTHPENSYEIWKVKED